MAASPTAATRRFGAVARVLVPPPSSPPVAAATAPNAKAFAWVNVPSLELQTKRFAKGCSHRTFHSPSLGQAVGYCIYLPPGAESISGPRLPVVYYLHGGRPGNELAGVGMSIPIATAIESGCVPPAIYVFPNGGPVSHYNYKHENQYGPAGNGEAVFIDELIPHIDKTFRTIADRAGRGIEGFSQGGRGVCRYMFSVSVAYYSGWHAPTQPSVCALLAPISRAEH